VHDLLLAKLAAGREKDLEFSAVAIRHGLVRQEVLIERLDRTPLPPEQKRAIASTIERQFRG
jgi:hypothetical protein